MIKISKLLGLVAALGREQSTGAKADMQIGNGPVWGKDSGYEAAECQAVEGRAGLLGRCGMDGEEASEGYLGCRGLARGLACWPEEENASI